MIKIVWQSLKPIFFVILVLGFVGLSLIIYDQFKTYQERKLGSQLIKNLSLEGSCKQIVNATGNFDLKFTLKNKNSQAIALKEIQIDKNLLGAGKKKFLDLTSTSPTSTQINTSQTQQIIYQFKSASIAAGKDLAITLSFKAASRNEASAAPHTIFIYEGTMLFDLEHEMTIETPCEIQVRYAN